MLPSWLNRISPRRYDGGMGADFTLPRVDPEVERSRESATRLLNALAQKLRASGVVRTATQKFHRAVENHTVEDMAAGIGRFVRRYPVMVISVAFVAGMLVGRSLRSGGGEGMHGR
jgi:hypothetical protein